MFLYGTMEYQIFWNKAEAGVPGGLIRFVALFAEFRKEEDYDEKKDFSSYALYGNGIGSMCLQRDNTDGVGVPDSTRAGKNGYACSVSDAGTDRKRAGGGSVYRL